MTLIISKLHLSINLIDNIKFGEKVNNNGYFLKTNLHKLTLELTLRILQYKVEKKV